MVNRNKRQVQWWVPVSALAVLALMEGWKMTLPDAAAGKEFLAQVREQVKDFPVRVGEWEGQDSKLPQEAIALLRPNFYLSRSYFNDRNDRVSFYFIEVEDTRDMMGHYPPNCYPGNGWELIKTLPASNHENGAAEWHVGDMKIPGLEYEFKQGKPGVEVHKWVRNFFLLPNGKYYPDIATFDRAASDFYIRPYGATQVQVIFDREYDVSDRDRIFESIITAHRKLFDAVRKKDL